MLSFEDAVNASILRTQILRFENLLSDISLQLLNLDPSRLDHEIEEGLRRVLDFFSSDRCFIIECAPDENNGGIVHAFCRDGVHPLPMRFDIRETFPALNRRLLSGKPYFHESFENISPELDGPIFRKYEIAACMFVPLPVRRAIKYVVGLLDSRPRRWSKQSRKRLRLLGEVFVNAMERASVEEKLRKSELKYRTVAEFTYDWEYWEDAGKLLYVSPSCERITGYSISDFVENPRLISDIVHSEDRPLWDEHYRDCHRINQTCLVEFRIRRKDGQIVWIEHACQSVIGKGNLFLGTRASNRDITVRKEMEGSLTESRAYLRCILESTDDMIAARDLDRKLTFFNKVYADFVRRNLGSEARFGIDSTDFVPGGMREHYRKAMDKVLLGAHHQEEMTWTKPDGTIRYYDLRFSPIYKEDCIIGMAAFNRDITDRKRMEDDLHKGKERLSEAYRLARLGNWDWDIEKNEIWWSEEIYRIFDMDPQNRKVTYEDFLQKVHPNDRHSVSTAVNRALKDPNFQYDIEHGILLSDGSGRTVHERGEVYFNAQGTPIRMAGSVQDITERKIVEEALKESREELIRLTGKLLHIQETERRRIARELHDDITQRLAVVAIEAGMLEKKYAYFPDSFRQALTKMQNDIAVLSGDIHAISRQLHPSVLDDLGLMDAVTTECNRFSALEAIPVETIFEDFPKELSKEKSLCLYRILQEGLRNIAKHSKALNARVKIAGKAEFVHFSLADDGVGFDHTAIKKNAGIGLVSMRERVRLVGGDWSICAHPAKGTIVKVRVPI